MRILYIDIDTLRPDHLGCYGYHRDTSPNIDALARDAFVFENVHASDVPCLPSRTALLTGRFGIHNGVVNHGGTDADPALDGAGREFWSRLQVDSFPSRLKQAGLRTVSISSFAQRHSAFHWYAGFDEAYNVGQYGLEIADDVHAIASDWLARNGSADNWFLHRSRTAPSPPGSPTTLAASTGTVAGRTRHRRATATHPTPPPRCASLANHSRFPTWSAYARCSTGTTPACWLPTTSPAACCTS